MLIIVLWAGPLLESLPMAIWLFSFLATILWDVSQGLVASVIFALFTIILQLQWASIAKLRRIGETEIYRNPELYLLSSSNPEIVIFSFNAPLMFLNSEQFKENMINHICEIEKESIIPRYLVLDASQISKCDKTGVLILEELSNELSRNYAITMLLASCS
uniref:STAS domain-containing protein n=1 Tax=Acrobeloides nanus TaxID=290746 RepID=A0A914DB51_9BILA